VELDLFLTPSRMSDVTRTQAGEGEHEAALVNKHPRCR
jgi:hypothetical protein